MNKKLLQQTLGCLKIAKADADSHFIVSKQDSEIFGYVIADLEKELAKPEQEPQVCCGDYEKCIEPCTPKGEWLAKKEFIKEAQLPPVDIGVDVTPEGTHVVACYNRPDAVQEMFYSQFYPLAKPGQEFYPDWDMIKPFHERIAELEAQLAKPEQASNEPPDYVEPPTSDYHNGWEAGFEAAKNLFKGKNT